MRELRLHVYDRKSDIKFLVDSGSIISLLPRSHATRKTSPEILKLTAANGSCINTYGQHVLTLDLGLRRAFPWAFVVADIKSDIIGADFLAHYGLAVDLKRRRIADQTTPCYTESVAHRAAVYGINVASPSPSTDGHIPQPLKDLIAKYSELLQPSSAPSGGPSAAVQNYIVTIGPPVFSRPRLILGDKLEAAKAEFDLLLFHGIIRPSSSQWASPLHMAPKGKDRWRPTGDFRRLNALTVPVRYPIPRIEDILLSLHSSTFFTTLDLNRAYFQVPVAREDVPKRAITTPFGLFEFLGMPLGLRNATQTFQRHMDNLFRDMPFVRVYIDDLLIVSSTLDEHLEHLQAVFDTLVRAKLTLNLGKCQFVKREVIFLGYSVNADGFKPPPDRIKAIVEYSRPPTIADLRRFRGLINFYHSLIPNAAEMQVPLTDLLQGAKKKDKRSIDGPPSARFLISGAPLALSADASSTDLGAALNQLINNVWNPLGFFSRKLTLTEVKYSPYDRELPAVFTALKHFEHMLEGREFIVRTDHKPLVKALERPEKASPRQLHQLDYISQFCMTFEHIAGNSNVVADALSRIEAIDMPAILDSATIHHAQQSEDNNTDHELATSSLRLQPLVIAEHRILCDTSSGVVRPYIPKNLRRTAFDVTHAPAHPSGRVTSRMIKEKFVWHGIKKDALKWSRECLPCQRAKIHRHACVPPTNIEVPNQRFNHVHLDLIVIPLVENYRYCLTMIDRFSRWPHAIPLRDMQAETVAFALYSNWIATFGTPLAITTDQETQFESALFTALAQTIGAGKIHTTPYHPQSNGILKAAQMCHPHVPWPQLLPTVLLGLRTAYKEDLHASPAELLYGTTLHIPERLLHHPG